MHERPRPLRPPNRVWAWCWTPGPAPPFAFRLGWCWKGPVEGRLRAPKPRSRRRCKGGGGGSEFSGAGRAFRGLKKTWAGRFIRPNRAWGSESHATGAMESFAPAAKKGRVRRRECHWGRKPEHGVADAFSRTGMADFWVGESKSRAIRAAPGAGMLETWIRWRRGLVGCCGRAQEAADGAIAAGNHPGGWRVR